MKKEECLPANLVVEKQTKNTATAELIFLYNVEHCQQAHTKRELKVRTAESSSQEVKMEKQR